MNINPRFQPGREFNDPTLIAEIGQLFSEEFAKAMAEMKHPLQVPIQLHGNEKFPLGIVLATEAARAALCPRCVALAIKAHAHGEWGQHVSKWDALRNDDAVKTGRAICSKYRGNDGVFFYVMTNSKRATTVVCLTHEYHDWKNL